MVSHTRQGLAWFTIGALLLAFGVGWMSYEITGHDVGHVRILMPLAMAAEPDTTVVVGPNTTYKFAWTNPLENTDVKKYELGIWPEGGGDVAPIKVLELTGPDVKYGAGTQSLVPIKTLVAAIGNGDWKVRARAVDDAGNVAGWAPAVAIKIRVLIDGPKPLIEFRIIAALSSGDCNGDGAIDIADMIWISNYLFGNGPKPKPCAWRV